MLSTDANGATDSDSVAITVASVNDGPVNTVPAAQSVNEDTALSISGVSVNDVDGNLSTTQLTVANGAVKVSLAGGATISAGANGTSTLTLSGTQAQINAALASLAYQGNAELQRLGHADGALDRRQRRHGFGRGLDHGQLGERRAGEHGAGRADGERGHRRSRSAGSRSTTSTATSRPRQLTVTNGAHQREPRRRRDDQRGRERQLDA